MELSIVSRTLTYYLRHKLDIFNHDEEGFVEYSLLVKENERLDISEEEIFKLVNSDKKSRLKLKFKNDKLFIRANQGHSVKVLDDNILLKKIIEPIDGCFHGTFKNVIDKISVEGLSRMTRKHIHFAKTIDSASGARGSCNVRIFIDMKKAILDGFIFYISENGVVLTEGNKDGFLPPQYFKDIVFL